MPTTGEYSIHKVYSQLMALSLQVRWAKGVWNRYTIPKHKFLLWLALKGRMQTTDRCAYGQQSDLSCVLCGEAPESLKHLFWSCPCNKQVWVDTQNWLGVRNNSTNLNSTMRWALGYNAINRFRRHVTLAALAAVVYTIWKARNANYSNP